MLATQLLRVSVVLAVFGVAMGIVMGARHDFTLMPAHAHLNLLGFVALFLAGLYYYVVPQAAKGTLAAAQAWISVVGAILFPLGIAAVLLGGPQFEFFTIIGSLIVLVGMVLFAAIVIRHGAPRQV
jgi:drug/metabolite transporter (DMT)-like permease